MLADARHHHQRPIRLPHGRDDRGQRAADLDRLRCSTASPLDSPSYEHGLLRQVPRRRRQHRSRARAARSRAAPAILQHARDIGITELPGILGGGVADYFNWTTFDINGPSCREHDVRDDGAHGPTRSTTSTQHEATSSPDEPWFLYQAYNAPHAANGGNNPYQVPPPEAALGGSQLGWQPSTRRAPQPTFPSTRPTSRHWTRSSDVCWQKWTSKNTVVIFLGDNGTPPPVKDTGSGRGAKGSVYEGGVRVPLIVAGAGVTRRGREDDLFVTTDLYAPILELSGVPVSQVNNSYSFKPLLNNAAATNGRTHSFTETSNGTTQRRYAVKDKRYKLVSNLGVEELYDLVADPLETTDLLSSPEHSAALATLEAEIDALRVQAPTYFP